jgi:hypothetical protein
MLTAKLSNLHLPRNHHWSLDSFLHANGVNSYQPRANALGKVQNRNKLSANGAIHRHSVATLGGVELFSITPPWG